MSGTEHVALSSTAASCCAVANGAKRGSRGRGGSDHSPPINGGRGPSPPAMRMQRNTQRDLLLWSGRLQFTDKLLVPLPQSTHTHSTHTAVPSRRPRRAASSPSATTGLRLTTACGSSRATWCRRRLPHASRRDVRPGAHAAAASPRPAPPPARALPRRGQPASQRAACQTRRGPRRAADSCTCARARAHSCTVVT